MSCERKPYFTTIEEELIQQLYTEHKKVIDAPFSSKITKKDKDKIWSGIANKVNSVSSTKRSAIEIRKKLKNMKVSIKKKVSQSNKYYKKTGGGPPFPQMSEKDARFAEVFAQDPAFHGIKGGIESGCTLQSACEESDDNLAQHDINFENSENYQQSFSSTSNKTHPQPIMLKNFATHSKWRKPASTSSENIRKLQMEVLQLEKTKLLKEITCLTKWEEILDLKKTQLNKISCLPNDNISISIPAVPENATAHGAFSYSAPVLPEITTKHSGFSYSAFLRSLE